MSSVLSASFRIPVNQSGNSPREPEFVAGTGGLPCIGAVPICEPFAFIAGLAASGVFWGACCIMVTCSGGNTLVTFDCCCIAACPISGGGVDICLPEGGVFCIC